VVNVLASNQVTLAQRFASRPADQSRFDTPPRLGSNGCPLIDGAVMQVECSLYARHDAGDHVIVIGMVTRSHVHDGNPILYCRGEFGAVATTG
jgi:flavin reductase (DIM6/NTAB) family NADH-FMN oxidoreductase RutF